MLSTTMVQSEITAVVDADALPALVESDSDDDAEPSNNSSSMCAKVWHLMKCIRCCWPSWPPARSGSSSLFLDSSAADTPTVGNFLLGAPFTIASIYQQANSGAATDALQIIDDDIPRLVPVTVVDASNDELVQRALTAFRSTVVANPKFGVASAHEFDERFELMVVERLFEQGVKARAQLPHRDGNGDGGAFHMQFQNGTLLWASETQFFCRTHAGANLTAAEDIDAYLLTTGAWRQGDCDRDDFLRLAARSP